MLKSSIVFLMCMIAFSIAQDRPKTVSSTDSATDGALKIGQRVTYYASFDGDPAFSSVALIFELKSTAPESQSTLPRDFTINESTTRLKPGLFKVEGAITKCARGRYELVDVQPRTTDSIPKDYRYPAGGQQPIQVEVSNDENPVFPPLKSVTSNVPK